MNFNLSSRTYGPLILQPELPAAFIGQVLPGSQPFCTEGAFGTIVIQKITTGRVTLLLATYDISEDLALDFKIEKPVLQTHIALKSDAQYYIKGIDTVYLTPGQFNMLSSASMEGTLFLEGGYEYKTLDIYFPPDYLVELVPIFSVVEGFIARATGANPVLLFENSRWINTAILEIIEQLLGCNFEGELRHYYFVHKVQELLFLLLSQEHSETITGAGLTQAAIDSIYQAKYIIETRFSEHLTLRSISQQVGLNEARLKAGFRLLFGIGMFEHLLKTRMQKAKTLLLQSDKPIKAIAKLTGYATKSSFLTAFKNYYDDTPGSFRKNS